MDGYDFLWITMGCMDCRGLYRLLWFCRDFWTFVWVLVCSISRV